MTGIKKLIEVALPLEAINRESAREKSIRHGHPSTLHLWWARRPLATARAVIFASLVDDPSSHPDRFSTEEAQNTEQKRLFALMEELVKWENVNNDDVLNRAREEIRQACNGEPPALLDPFAGGGSIPLEAQRLGLKAYAADLNPVAVMINKAMIEIPPLFAGSRPVNPEARNELAADWLWKGAAGLAEDVRYYGQWMKEEAFKRIGHLYPKVQLPPEQGGGEATVIAWIWARTVKCPNPACGCEMPLASSFVLSKKKGKEVWIEPIIDDKANNISYIVKSGKGTPPAPPKLSRGAKFKCIKCGESTTPDYIKDESINGRMSAQLMAVVAEGRQGRVYISPDESQRKSADVKKPDSFPDGELAGDKRAIWCPLYGLTHFSDLFTNRQLTALTTFSDLVREAQAKAEADALAAGMADDGIGLADGGTGAKAYGQAVGVYLAFVVDKLVDRHSSICIWDTTRDSLANTMRRQAIQMTWDYAEANPFSASSGCFENMLVWIEKCLHSFSSFSDSKAFQYDAQTNNFVQNVIVSTDPPYYDNIGYADLSDYFYIWMRQSLKNTYPDIFKTVLVPKSEELVATPYRFDGNKVKSKEFFEDGMLKAFRQVYGYADNAIPVTIYYAFKQSDSDANETGQMQTASTGWETMLAAIIKAGFVVVGTWPMRTELTTALKGKVNALASSIVLVCRKRPLDAPACTRRDFLAALKRELRPALHELQRANIAPVDLAQSAIGPGMGVYSRYTKVLEADGTPMSVRAALQIINQEVDTFFTEQEGELDAESRFCIALYSQYAFNDMKFGEADVLARAKNTSVERLAAQDILYAQKGVVHLLERDQLPTIRPDSEKILWLFTQQLAHAMQKGGVDACAQAIAPLHGSAAENAKALAYRLYTLAEQKGWAQEARVYNELVTAWPEIQAKVAALKKTDPQGKFRYSGDINE